MFLVGVAPKKGIKKPPIKEVGVFNRPLVYLMGYVVFPSSKPLILLYSQIRVLSSKIVQSDKNKFFLGFVHFLLDKLPI